MNVTNTVNTHRQSRQSPIINVSYAAYGAALLFALHLISYFIPAISNLTMKTSLTGAIALAVLAVGEHLLVIPIIATLPAPKWAKAIGYGWLVLDMATDILQLVGVAKLIYLSLRYVANVAAAVWYASASWKVKGAMHNVGLVMACDIALYSFIAFIPFTFVLLIPSVVLVPIWFVLVGRMLTREHNSRQVFMRASVQ